MTGHILAGIAMPIVTSTYRYNPPPKRKGHKLAEITGPHILTIDPKTRVAKKSRRPTKDKAAAEVANAVPRLRRAARSRRGSETRRQRSQAPNSRSRPTTTARNAHRIRGSFIKPPGRRATTAAGVERSPVQRSRERLDDALCNY